MKVATHTICKMSMPYAVSTVEFEGREQVLAATEDHGPTIVASPPEWTAREVVEGPGGCMSIAKPKASDDIYAIYGCFVGYHFEEGAVYRLTHQGRHGESSRPLCTAERVFPLPFAHRICFATRNGTEYLVAASLAESKSSPDDWTKPGTVYAGVVPTPSEAEAQSGPAFHPQPILENLHKNHCMFSGTLDGRRTLMIGGTEGLFGFDLDGEGDDWKRQLILESEISEVVIADLDNDGRDELITIEPFHGNRLFVYHAEEEGWRRVFDIELDYGHGLWSGTIAGRSALVVGNRSGDANLDILLPRDGLKLERHTVAEGAGSANTAVVNDASGSWIVAANQSTSEVVAYQIDEL